ncbi:YfhO family protein [Liquorilactobacillus sicerae]|uniref:YfhO family protein n=1 Tax=Liquorilactobacillus sicerae TaxID=1416943 RepID=UPI0024814A18|nr:YfhO family protein [Liquorilactobacillus sicerae]
MHFKKSLTVCDYLAAFLLSFVLIALAYYLNGIYWDSQRSILASDAFTQTLNFYDSFHDVLHGKSSFFYNWNAAFGVNYLGIYSYYLGGPVTLLVYFFKKNQMENAVYLLTLLKFGLAGLSSYWFAKRTFALASWQRHLLALCYSLMAFGVAYAEQTMWLDILYLLPLVIAGVNHFSSTGKKGGLFWMYSLLFIMNFYLAYMVGIFSFLYYLAINWATKRLSLWQFVGYCWTTVCSLLAASWLVLPVILFMQRTHEPLSRVTGLFTNNSGIWDLVIKNMVGVYDTTKYGTVPFVYVGLLPLLLAIYFFFQPENVRRLKLGYGGLLLALLLGFYLQVVDLTWQGWHAPSMFLYRYSFLWSFMIFLLAGKAWEKLTKPHLLIKVALIYLLITVVAFLGSFGHYHYAGVFNFSLTLVLLLLYCLLLSQPIRQHRIMQIILFSVLVSFEVTFNAFCLLRDTNLEWHYPASRLATQNSAEIEADLKIDRQSDTVLRAANLDEISRNDSLQYNYSAADFFSSMRNRPFQARINQLGFKSGGNNLNFAYANNTLVMDGLMGIKLNLAKGRLNKYGFKLQSAQGNTFHLYHNQLAPGLAIQTNQDLSQLHFDNQILANQTALLNAVSDSSHTQQYFSQKTPQLTLVNNTQATKDRQHFYLNASQDNSLQTLTWKVNVPANSQAYFDLSLLSNQGANGCQVVLNLPQQDLTTNADLNLVGQFFDLGYYRQAQTITFTTKIYGSHQMTFAKPQVIFLKTHQYQAAAKKMLKQTVPLRISQNQAQGVVKRRQAGWLYTSIPADPGWQVKINGQRIKTRSVAGIFLTLPLKAGTNHIKLTFIPPGFELGVVLTILGLLLFAVGWLKTKWQQKRG